MSNANLIVGTDGSDTLIGTAGRDLIYGFNPDGPQGDVTSIAATRVADGLAQPIFVGAPPGDLERLFIVEREGTIKILDVVTGEVLTENFLDISSSVTTNGEGGLLGLAFDPDFATNGYFYVDFTNTSGDTEVRRYQVSASDPNLADPASELKILTVDQPADRFNHKAGWIGFGPDGYLYVALGDGGGQGDPNNNGQNINVLLGKMLRLDVRTDGFPGDASRNYAIPADNPFVGVAGADEIYALGLRNPFRNSFDRGLGDFYIADVGQSKREEVDLGALGANYGWDRYEGTLDFSPNTPLAGGTLTFPIHQYTHGIGHSIVGGYAYRGVSEGLQGDYFFADYVDNKLFTLHFDGSAWVATNRTTQLVPDVPTAITNIASFGEDGAGNLYVVSLTAGDVFRLTPVVASADQADVLRGGDGDDMLFGGSGADQLIGGAGDDTMLGGLGNDSYRVDAGDLVVETANQGTDTVLATTDFSLADGTSVEILRADAGKQGLALTGNAFDNTIIGDTGADTLIGAAGNDTLQGGRGADEMLGGAGDDAYYVNSAADQLLEGADEGTDTVYAAADYALADNLEILRANAGKTGLTLTGNALDNLIVGARGDDNLVGGAGSDELYGKVGNDTFTFAAGFGHDRIADFVAGGAVDVIRFDHALFADFAAVMAAATQVGADTVITYDSNNSVTLTHVQRSALISNDFAFF